MVELTTRVYFCASKTAMVHNLMNPCSAGRYITQGNFEDFATYEEAIEEIKKRNKVSQLCKLCQRKGEWKND